MSVVRFSCPQLLDVALRAPQHPVDQESVGVGRYLGRYPGGKPHEGGGQSLAQTEDPLEARKSDLYVLPRSAPPLGSLGGQEDAYLGQGLPQILTSVGQISQQPPRYPLSQSSLVDEFLSQGDVRYVGRGQLVRDGHPVGRTDEVQLHPVDAETSPPHPRRSRKARALSNLARMDNFQQRRVHKQGLRLAYQPGEDLPPQRLEVAPELLHSPVEGGRVEPYHPRKQMREESLGIPQQRAFAFHAPKLLEQGEGDHFRVREALYGLVASSTVRVERGVSVIYEAEEHGQSLFQVNEGGGMLGLGHPRFLSLRVRMAPVVSSIHATHI